MSIICLISCRLRCRSRSVGLIISYGDVKELEIQLKYTVAFFSLESFALTKIPVQRTDWLSCDLKKDKIMWQESNNGIIVYWTEYICTVISDG